MMNNRLAIVAVLTVVVVVAATLVSQHRAPQTSRQKTALFPDLAGRINDVSELVIRDGQTTLTVRRKADGWSIAEADDYPALTDSVKQAALAVSDLQVIAGKTDNPDLYGRLGVEDPDSQGATSHLLTLTGNGEQLAELIVGDARRSKSAANAPGLYVRIPGQQQALLVEGRLSVSADLTRWIKRDIISIEADRVNTVRVRPAGAAQVFLKRDKLADDLALQDIPEGKERESEYLLSRMATILENIYVDGVKKEDNVDFARPDSIVDVTTFDGLTARVEVVALDGHSYARFAFAAQAGVTDGEPATDADGAADAAEADAADPEEEPGPTPEQEAEALNDQLQGWAYRLSTSKAELFNQTLADLVRDPATETAG